MNNKKPIKAKSRSRHGKYRVGTTKITVTVDNEDKVKVHRDAVNRGFKDDSAYLRSIIHEAVFDVMLEAEDYEELKRLNSHQENN